MKINYSYSILVWLYKAKMKKGKCPIYIRVTIDSKRTEIATKKWIEPEKWDSNKQAAKGITEEARLINQYISVLKGNIESIYLKLQNEDKIPSPNEIKNQLLGIKEEQETIKEKTVSELFEYFLVKINERKEVGKVCAKTALRYQITYNKIIAFIKESFSSDDLPLSSIRLPFALQFEHFLLTKQKLQSNTAHKYIKNLKTVFNFAVQMEWIPSNVLNSFKCSYVSPDREVLTQDEIFLLYNKEISNPRLAEVRDVFIFACYTGFSYAELESFKSDAPMKDITGTLVLSANRQKTGNKETVPLLDIPIAIIQKYKSHPYCTKHNKLLPVSSNQKYNAYLKELASICNLNKLLTTHIARHTFATTITLANGVPIETVGAMLGHQDTRTTKIYAKMVQKKINEDMHLLQRKFSNQNTMTHTA